MSSLKQITEKFASNAVKVPADHCHRVALPNDNPKFAVTMETVLTERECEMLIQEAEKRGFADAPVNIGGGRQVMMKDYRDSDRVIIDSPELAEILWQRIKDHIPQEFQGKLAVGLNERLRFLRYDPGQKFSPHCDGSFMRSLEAGDRRGEISFVTVQFYLNGGFEGGATTFLSVHDDTIVPVVPTPGLALVFQHDIMHEGSKLIKGRKYCIRTDVMYTPHGPGNEYSVKPIRLAGDSAPEVKYFER